MLPYRDAFLTNNPNEGIAICGSHVGADAIHVGLFWNYEGETRVIHFLSGQNIPVQEVSDAPFANYFFNPIPDFPADLIPSLSALSELISQNQLNGFTFRRVGLLYDGGKFDFQTGAYTGKTPAEKYVNCAVFVIALLRTYDYILLDWDSWPNANPANRTFLDQWLNNSGIPARERQQYYNMTKEVRGKHVIVCPGTTTKPSPHMEAQTLADALINDLSP